MYLSRSGRVRSFGIVAVVCLVLPCDSQIAQGEDDQVDVTLVKKAEAGEGLVVQSADDAAKRRHIEEELDGNTQMEFVDAPLSDVLQYIEDLHQIDIEFDQGVLDDAGVTGDLPVTRSLKGVKLRNALELILNDSKLDYVLRNEVLVVTTRAVADKYHEQVVYPVADLLPESADASRYEELVKALREIAPATWKPSGDELLITRVGATLVISQSQRVHRQIASLLATLRAAQVK